VCVCVCVCVVCVLLCVHECMHSGQGWIGSRAPFLVPGSDGLLGCPSPLIFTSVHCPIQPICPLARGLDTFIR
jgi:hypothetical protein